jgi:SH3-like domain-containing protein
MELGMPVRASVAGMLGALIVVGVTWLGGTALSMTEITVLREAPAVPSPTPAPSPVATASPVAAPRVRVVGGGASEVNLRAEPRVSGTRLKGLSDGVQLELLGLEVEVGGRTWRRVRDPADRAEGWVAAELLGPDK